MMEDRAAVKAFRALEKKRLEIMVLHHGADSPEEDAMLEEMDDAWWKLSQEERDYLNSHPGPYHNDTVKWLELGGA
jgi:hypothetical protein